MLNSKNLKKVLSFQNKEHKKTNCWGSSAYIHGLTKQWKYLEMEEMEYLLDSHFEEIEHKNGFKVGDVLAFYSVFYVNLSEDGVTTIEEVPFSEDLDEVPEDASNWQELTHVATFVGRGQWLEQSGFGAGIWKHGLKRIVEAYGDMIKLYRRSK